MIQRTIVLRKAKDLAGNVELARGARRFFAASEMTVFRDVAVLLRLPRRTAKLIFGNCAWFSDVETLVEVASFKVSRRNCLG